MDYSRAIEVAKGIYWVGYTDETHGLHSNPYLVTEGVKQFLLMLVVVPIFLQ